MTGVTGVTGGDGGEVGYSVTWLIGLSASAFFKHLTAAICFCVIKINVMNTLNKHLKQMLC